jgi:hypothetical protein
LNQTARQHLLTQEPQVIEVVDVVKVELSAAGTPAREPRPGRYMTLQKPIIVAFKLFMRCLASPGFGLVIVAMTHGRSIPS